MNFSSPLSVSLWTGRVCVVKTKENRNTALTGNHATSNVKSSKQTKWRKCKEACASYVKTVLFIDIAYVLKGWVKRLGSLGKLMEKLCKDIPTSFSDQCLVRVRGGRNPWPVHRIVSDCRSHLVGVPWPNRCVPSSQWPSVWVNPSQFTKGLMVKTNLPVSQRARSKNLVLRGGIGSCTSYAL